MLPGGGRPNCNSCVPWTPVQAPPDPHSLHSNSGLLFNKILEALNASSGRESSSRWCFPTNESKGCKVTLSTTYLPQELGEKPGQEEALGRGEKAGWNSRQAHGELHQRGSCMSSLMSGHAVSHTGNFPPLAISDNNLYHNTGTRPFHADIRRPPVALCTAEPHFGPSLGSHDTKEPHLAVLRTLVTAEELHCRLSQDTRPLIEKPHYGSLLDTTEPRNAGLRKFPLGIEEVHCSNTEGVAVSEGAHCPDGTVYPATRPHPTAWLKGESATMSEDLMDMSTTELPGEGARGRRGEEGVVRGRGGARKRRRESSEEAVTLHRNLLRQLEPAGAQQAGEKEGGGNIDVGRMSREELERLQRALTEAQEVAMTVLYSDGTTQLSTKPDVSSVCVAYPVEGDGAGASAVLHYVSFPLSSQDSSVQAMCRTLLVSLMGRSRVITYGGQELILALLSNLDKVLPEVWRKWCPLDTGLGAWLLDPDNPPNSFSELLARHGLQQLAPPSSQEGTGREEGLDIVCRDLALLGPLMVKIYQKLQSLDLLPVFLEVETKVIPILAAMSHHGIQVNCNKLLQFEEDLKKRIAMVQQSAHKVAGRSFHINSTSQLRQILFDELHLDDNKTLSKTQVHQHKSTSEAVLTQLSPLHPLPKLVLEYRQLCKINATYITGLMTHVYENVVRPSWLQSGAATGRLVACNPNIQAFPKHTIHLGAVNPQFIVAVVAGKEAVEVGINVRELIESRQHFTFLAADFKSVELRVLAHLSADAQLLSAFTSPHSTDIFINLTSEWLGKPISAVTAADRERTKHVVYAVIYGVGKERLGEIMQESPSAARELTSSFLARFPGIQNYMSTTVAQCRKKGYLSTVCQRRRWFPLITSPLPHLRTHAERQAINFPVQGSAADICKLAMVEVTAMLAKESPCSRLLVQIHDELLIEVPDEEVSSVSEKVKKLLEAAETLPCKLKVPLEVKMSTGKTWASLTTDPPPLSSDTLPQSRT